jgi:Protein of unknown function (DUF1488)
MPTITDPSAASSRLRMSDHPISAARGHFPAATGGWDHCDALEFDCLALGTTKARAAFGIWIAFAIGPVRGVLVSYEALSELDPTNVRDLHGALENFDRFRSQIESAASRKFDRNGFDPDKYEGMPAIRLITNNLT